MSNKNNCPVLSGVNFLYLRCDPSDVQIGIILVLEARWYLRFHVAYCVWIKYGNMLPHTIHASPCPLSLPPFISLSRN